MDDRATPPTETIADSQSDAVTVVGGNASCGVVVLCDHASNALPPEYGTLGLNAGELVRHIAYDIGAEGVTRGMARRLGAPAVLSRYSRLLIDPNRGDDDPTLIMRISDGAVVAGNRKLDDGERERRIARVYRPYHAAIRGVIDQCMAAGPPPILVSIHSFTPLWKAVPRPWHVGILWDKDPRLAVPLLDALGANRMLVVGDNEPYSGVLKGDTLWQHGSQRGLAHAIIEVRQDLIATEAGQDDWAGQLSDIVTAILADPERAASIQCVTHYGSHTDHWPIETNTQGRP
jgi:predicted N-formylglutamate amidohydrolase